MMFLGLLFAISGSQGEIVDARESFRIPFERFMTLYFHGTSMYPHE